VVGAAARTDRSNTCEASGMLAGGFHRPVSINIVDMRQDQTVDLPHRMLSITAACRSKSLPSLAIVLSYPPRETTS